MNKPLIWGILVAGGSGRRYSATTSKLLEHLAGKPIFQRSLEALCQIDSIEGLVIVAHPQWKADYQACLNPNTVQKPIVWANGGETRRASVWNGLQAIPDKATIVLIHDAARPLVHPDKIKAVLQPVIQGQAMGTSLGILSKNTLKQVSAAHDPWVTQTLNREQIWQVHTPQVFQKEALLKAHQQVSQTLVINDDAELVVRQFPNRQAVLMVEDNATNLKITTPQDLQLAEALLKQPFPALKTH